MRIKEFSLKIPDNVKIFNPIGYKDLLYLINSCSHVLTDSGTVVEESCIMGIPSIQMRFSTERPEVYDVGSSIRFDPRNHDYSKKELNMKIDSIMKLRKGSWKHPFGDGKASERIAGDIIKRAFGDRVKTHDPKYIFRHVLHSIR
jgi:UDP-N-acetylglucosamine 2-epimerase (non-hydrolysing)